MKKINKDLPLYRLVINEEDDDNTGISMVALVSEPAIQTYWMAFNSHNEEDKGYFKFNLSEEKRIITAPLLIPNLPIYRRDEKTNEEFYVVFDADTIEKIMFKYMRRGKMDEVNIMHDGVKIDDVLMFESALIDSARGNNPSWNTFADGTWLVSFKVNNDKEWSNIKEDKYRGFSVEGNFIPVLIGDRDVDVIEKLTEIILKDK